MCLNSTFLVASDFLRVDDYSRLEDHSEWRKSAMIAADNLLLMLHCLDQKILKTLKVTE